MSVPYFEDVHPCAGLKGCAYWLREHTRAQRVRACVAVWALACCSLPKP